MRTRCAPFIWLLASLVILHGPALKASETFYMDPVPESQSYFGLSFMHWLPEGTSDQNDFDGTYDLYVDAVVTDRLNLRVKLPFSRMSIPYYYDFPVGGTEITGATVGNLYVGLTHKSVGERNSVTFYSAGIYLPTSGNTDFDSYINSIAVLANFHQFERVVPDMYTVYLNVAYRNNSSDVTIFGLEFGPQIFIPKSRDVKGGRDTEVLMHYGLSSGIKLAPLTIMVEVLGLAIITEDVDDFEDRFEHHAAFGVSLNGHNLRSSLFYQIPLHDDLKEITKGVLGVKLEVAF